MNRLDEIILFKPLSKENIGGIIDILLADLNKRLVDKELTISLSESGKALVMEQAYDPVYGARPLKRYLQKHVETQVAKLILTDQVSMGQNIVLTDVDGQLLAQV